MSSSQYFFIITSTAQAKYILGYAFNVGKGTPANARIMKAAMNQLYGAQKAKKIFSLADYLRLEAKKEGKQEGMRKGVEKGMMMLTDQLKKAGVSQNIIEKAVHQQQKARKSQWFNPSSLQLSHLK